jgi:hypothetical protein
MQAAGGIGVGSSLYIADSGKPEVLHHNVYFLYVCPPPGCLRFSV